MIKHCAAKLFLIIAIMAVGPHVGSVSAVASQLAQAGDEEGMQVLTRGPVHEAFAGTITFNPEPGMVAPKAAPEAIEELPPEQKPVGDNVAWIPGYWAWDDERTDFLWVSGVWRALPPARQWVSGYWGKSSQGFQWTSGYWADAQASEVEYLPEPPVTVEAGPNIAAPSADYVWVPGSWMWRQNRYAWRPGYWATAQADWVWIPSYYVWAPRGYVFVDGYWDYSVARRGVLFAPVYFDASVHARRGFRYSPATIISLSVFSDHLFSRPRYHHYYFGDYYGGGYQTAGYYPSHSSHTRDHGYDPIYTHQRWQHRQDREWEHRVEAQFQHRHDHEDARPPCTWVAQRERGRSAVASKDTSFVVASTLDQLAKSPDSRMRFQAVDKEERKRFSERGQEVRRFREERQKLEDRTADAPAEGAGKATEPRRVKRPRSPIVAKAAEERDQDHAPPKSLAPKAPELDPKIEPKPRSTAPIVEPPKVERGPERPTTQPRPERPAVEPRPERPKVETRSERPQVEPKPERPKVETRPERPKAEARPERPKVESRPERPKAESQPERPKVDRQRPERAKGESRPERKAEAKPERQKPAESRPERPKVESKQKEPKGRAEKD